MKIVGHEAIREKLESIVKTGNIANAYLFVGVEGIGKKLVATEFAKSILNDEASYHADLKEIAPEKDVIKVDVIRGMIDEVYLMPTISQRKVFVIDDADKMNEQAQNALLKVLEEPPIYATIILIASSKEKLLNTIKSRVVEFPFQRLKKEEIEQILKDNTEASKEQIKDAVMFSNGSVARALTFLSDNTFQVAKELSDCILEKDFLKTNRKLESIKADKMLKANITDILEKVMYLFYQNLKADISFDYYLIEALQNAIENIKRNANVDLTLDMLAITVSELSSMLS